MRVIWLDSDSNPWTGSNGWTVLEDFGVKVQRVPEPSHAEPLLKAKNFDLVLVRVEVPGALDFLVKARKLLGKGPRKLLLISSEWSKEQFKEHSRTPGAANRYARVPMPPEGFLGLIADLFGCAVEELAGFDSSLEEALEEPPKSSAQGLSRQTSEPRDTSLPTKGSQRKSATPSPIRQRLETDDVDTLKKYLRIKEEQLSISEDERRELVLENERYQREANEILVRLRSLEYDRGDLDRKLKSAEEERKILEKKSEEIASELEREHKTHIEKAKKIDSELKDSQEKYESLRVRVRKDIRRIRENERELEARLELSRKDAETLIRARDDKVLELQRKIDALEFDLDQVQDSRVQAQMEAEKYLVRLSRVSRALRIANGLLQDDGAGEDELDGLEPFVGGAALAEDLPLEPEQKEEPLSSESVAGESFATRSKEGESPSSEDAPTEEAPFGAEPPPTEADDGALVAQLEELANDGEPTQMISRQSLEQMGEEEQK
jgi:hypothetical protein